MRLKKILATMLVASLTAVVAAPVLADELEQMQQEVAENTAALSNVQEAIGAIEVEKEKLVGEIDTLDKQLVVTLANVESLSNQILDMEEKLVQTGKDLATAEDKKDVQYGAMKKRIQYLYETGGEAGWAVVFLENGNISDVLNQSEYTNKMYEYDRKCLQDYVDIVTEVETLQKQQRQEKASLEEAHMEQKAQQQVLETLLDEAKKSFKDYEKQLAEAQEIAQKYVELINRQNEQIRQLQAEREAARRAAEEAARQAAAYAAAQQAAAQAAAQQAAAQAAAQQAAAQQAAAQAESASVAPAEGGGDAADTAVAGASSEPVAMNPTGNDIVDYAMQFVGNPYVWGGNSLTNGIDCSHFVTAVLQNTGNYSGSYAMAEYWPGIGETVSYADAQPGDVLCYSGHVGIYAGDGKIVHAANSQQGIIVSDATYSNIISVQRVSN